MIDTATILAVALTFGLAGLVKGLIGFGLPSVSLALLTATIGLQPAMALVLVPSFATNVWQAAVGGNGRKILLRLWPFLLAATVMIWFGTQLLTRIDTVFGSALLGALLIAYGVLGLSRLQISIPGASEFWAGPLAGALNGVLTGLTGSFVVPGVLYLQAIGLPRDMLVQAMGMLFTASTVGLAVSLGGQQLLSPQLGILSAAAVAPALLGMMVGQIFRSRISEYTFRRVFLVSLTVLGLYILVSSFF